jgi:hypothetical protein
LYGVEIVVPLTIAVATSVRIESRKSETIPGIVVMGEMAGEAVGFPNCVFLPIALEGGVVVLAALAATEVPGTPGTPESGLLKGERTSCH